jgi:arylsulfatase A-like enzyme
VIRYPRRIKAGTRTKALTICQDIAPTLIELAGGKPGPQIQGRSLVNLFRKNFKKSSWRKAVLAEYWAEQAYPWLIGMTYKAIRTERYKLIHWVNRDRDRELDELYDLEKDPCELKNLIASRAHAGVREKLRRDLKKLIAEAVGI